MEDNKFLIKLSNRIVSGFGLLVTALVLLMSLCYSYDVVNQEFQFETVQITTSPLLMLGISVVGMIFLFLTAVGIDKFLGKKGDLGLFIVSLLWVIGVCAWWIVNAKAMPGGDSKSLYDIALRAVNGDLTPIAPVGSYMALWPHQTGLLGYFETVLRVFPGADYTTFQWLNLVFLVLGYIATYLTVREWFHKEVITNLWCLLMMVMLPLYLLVNLIYGDIPGLALICIATYLFTLWQKNGTWYFLCLACLSLFAGVALRKNYAIFAVAVIIIYLVYAIAHKKLKFLVAAACVAISIFLASALPTKFYEMRAHNTLGGGVPTVSFLVMGLNNIGWSGYHSDLFLSCDYDEELTKEISRKDLQETLVRMAEEPGRTLDFFREKQSAQWAHQTNAYVVSTVYTFEQERSEGAWEVYSGDLKQQIQRLMDVVQSVIYLGAFLYLANMVVYHAILKKKLAKVQEQEPQPLWNLVWLVTVIGGFFFTLVWEGGARYTLPFVVMMIPYAAGGIFAFGQYISKFVKNTCKS